MGDQPGRCLVQLFSQDALRHETSVAAHAARVSLSLAQNFSLRHKYRHLVYDCATAMHCAKPPALADACWMHGCTHILFLDSDVFITNELIDPIDDIVSHFPEAVMALGVDYYGTMKEKAWHDGKWRMYLTPSNAGMFVMSCTHPASKRLIASWDPLCRHYSPSRSDQEAITLLETLPQFMHAGTFVRDTLTLGQYSRFAKHFPGDSGKAMHSWVPGERGFRRYKDAVLTKSGMYKAMTRSTGSHLLTATENWRFTGEHGDPPIWYHGKMQECPSEDHLIRVTYPQHFAH